jgi:hypothetical protein
MKKQNIVHANCCREREERRGEGRGLGNWAGAH